MDLQALVDYVEVNRTGFRKALKKHDKVLGALGHPKLLATYFPKVEASFPEKHRLRVQVLSGSLPGYPMVVLKLDCKPEGARGSPLNLAHMQRRHAYGGRLEDIMHQEVDEHQYVACAREI